MKCLVRDKDVAAAPEERVRQRVLHWLLHGSGVPRLRISLEAHLAFANRSRGRADIVVWMSDDHAQAELLIECKAEGLLLGEDVVRQATAYAQRLRCTDIWLTNGTSHRFLKKGAQRRWEERPTLEVWGRRLRAAPSPAPRPPSRLLPPRKFRQLWGAETPSEAQAARCSTDGGARAGGAKP
jgi:hypothetical protein